jgi:hypothetical protein
MSSTYESNKSFKIKKCVSRCERLLISEQSQRGLDRELNADGRQSQVQSDASQDTQAMVALDNKHNLAQREQYYAAVQKGISTHAVERIPGENFENFPSVVIEEPSLLG